MFEMAGVSKEAPKNKPKGEPITIEADDVESLADSVDEIFGEEVENVEVDWSSESKAVVAVAEQKLLANEQIQAYLEDNDFEHIVNEVIKDITTDSEQIRIFQTGINAATDKAAYVEQATDKLVDKIKNEIDRRISEEVMSQEGNA